MPTPRSTTRLIVPVKLPAERLAWLPVPLLLIAVLLVWPGSLAGPFQFDDWNVIVEQPAVHSLGAWWASMPGIRPLLKLSYALNWQLVPGAGGFHLVNLIIHAINGWLVWQLLAYWPPLGRRPGLPSGHPPGLTPELRRGPSSRVPLERLGAFWITLIFLLHPVQTEAVTYISGRSMSLMTMFWLAAALCWLGPGEPNRRWKLAAAALFIAALAVRETAWALPLALLVWQRAQGVSWRQAACRLAPMWAVLLAAGMAVLSLPAYRSMLLSALATRDPLSNLALQVEVLAYLLVQPLVLLRNNIDPDLPAAASFGPLWWLALGVIALLVGFGLRWLTRRPWAALALLWPFILLLPTNGLLARFDPAAERHLYLALLGPAVLLVNGVLLAGRRFGAEWLAAGGLAAIVLVLGSATMARINDYRSESALWTATSLRSPNKARVWNNLGYAHLVEARPDLAKPALERAVKLDSDFMRARLNLERAVAAMEK